MKLIDEKGKLFGFINIIDLGVILLVLLLVGAVGYKMAGRQIQGNPVVKKEIWVTVRSAQKQEQVAKSFADAVASGDQKNTRMLSLSTYVDAYLVNVKVDPADYTVSTDDGRLLRTKHPFLKDVLITFKMDADMNAPLWKLGSQEVAVGKSFFVKTQKLDLGGFIDSIEVK